MGTPEKIIKIKKSYTGQYLAKKLNKKNFENLMLALTCEMLK